MIISIHQPMYIPWIGYFHKMMSADKFVILDDVEFSKNDWFNRNKIKSINGEMWLTVPIIYKDSSNKLIKDIIIDNSKNWKRKHLKSIKLNYSKALYINEYIDFIETIFSTDWRFLIDLNLKMIEFIKKELKIEIDIVLSSEMKVQDESTERLISICKKLNADKYLSGLGAKDYLSTELFVKNNIELLFQEFNHPVYQQLHGQFVSHLSIIDLLLNCGPDESRKLILYA